MKLTECAANKDYIVIGYQAGKNASQRLQDLGLFYNTQFKVINNSLHCPILLYVRNTKLIVGRGLASKILVGEIK